MKQVEPLETPISWKLCGPRCPTHPGDPGAPEAPKSLEVQSRGPCGFRGARAGARGTPLHELKVSQGNMNPWAPGCLSGLRGSNPRACSRGSRAAAGATEAPRVPGAQRVSWVSGAPRVPQRLNGLHDLQVSQRSRVWVTPVSQSYLIVALKLTYCLFQTKSPPPPPLGDNHQSRRGLGIWCVTD